MKKCFMFLFLFISFGHAEVVEKEGKGHLEIISGQKVLYLQGTPYEMGFQHGTLMSAEIKSSIKKYLEGKSDEIGKKVSEFASAIPNLLSYLPKKYLEEMRGVADGAKVSFKKVILLNLFPEMFHCSAITATDKATRDGNLYHVRVLDYTVGKGLQDSAVIIVQKPDFGNSFVNVSYAGFIGSVTGMNDQKISVGEIGAGGYGKWDGLPMTFIIREILENASDISTAKRLLNDVKRTCNYFYIIADGNAKKSFSAFATPEKISFIEPGENYKFSKISRGESINNPFFELAYEKILVDQQIMETSDNNPTVLHGQHQDVLSLMGFDYEYYPILYKRIGKFYGKIDPKKLIKIIKRPVARKSNLHNVIFSPCTGDFWVAHAGINDAPACDQKYSKLNIFELLQR